MTVTVMSSCWAHGPSVVLGAGLSDLVTPMEHGDCLPNLKMEGGRHVGFAVDPKSSSQVLTADSAVTCSRWPPCKMALPHPSGPQSAVPGPAAPAAFIRNQAPQCPAGQRCRRQARSLSFYSLSVALMLPGFESHCADPALQAQAGHQSHLGTRRSPVPRSFS